MVLHVALLGESDAAQLTLEGLLPRVFDHMDLQRALLVEGLVTLIALEGPFACTTHTHTPAGFELSVPTVSVSMFHYQSS